MSSLIKQQKTPPLGITVIELFDFYYNEYIYMRYHGKCKSTICENSMLYKIASTMTSDVELIEEIVRRSQCYTMCIEKLEDDNDNNTYDKEVIILNPYKQRKRKIKEKHDKKNHVCNALMLMIGTKTEFKIINILIGILKKHNIYKNEHTYYNNKLAQVFQGTFISNGNFVFSPYRDTNNKDLCHYHNETMTTCYCYDRYGRGHRIQLQDNILEYRNRDGKTCINITDEQYRKITIECAPKLSTNNNEAMYSFSVAKLKLYMNNIKERNIQIDDFKNKLILHYVQVTLNTINQIDLFQQDPPLPNGWNSSILTGHVVFGISQKLKYDPSKSEYSKRLNKNLKKNKNIHTNKDIHVPKTLATSHQFNVKNKIVIKSKPENENISSEIYNEEENDMLLGSCEFKHSILKKLFHSDNTTSLFMLIDSTHLDKIEYLTQCVHRIRPTNVRSHSAMKVPNDAIGWLCLLYLGNIGSAARKMLLVKDVKTSYGHADLIFPKIMHALLPYLQTNDEISTTILTEELPLMLVINNFPTKYYLKSTTSLCKFIQIVKSIWTFVEILRLKNCLCLNLFAGIAMKKIGNYYLSRSEYEQFTLPEFQFQFEKRTLHMSQLAYQLDYFTFDTPASKRTVSVNAFKSALPHSEYLKYGKLLNRHYQIFTSATELSYDGKKTFYKLFTVFGDFHGYNVEDGYVVNEKLDFNLNILLNYNLLMNESNNPISIVIPSDHEVSILEWGTNPSSSKTHLTTSYFDTSKTKITGVKGNSIPSNALQQFPITTHIHMCTVSCESEIDFFQYSKLHIYQVSNEKKHYIYHIYIICTDEMFNRYIGEGNKPQIQIRHFRFEVGGIKKLGLHASLVFKAKNFYGLKLNNCYGQKGVMRPMNLSHLKYQNPITKEWQEPDVITNNCTFVSRAANGQLKEMSQQNPFGNISVHNTLDPKDVGLGGFCNFLIIENNPSQILSIESDLKLEPMSAMALLQNRLALTLNVKYADNTHNQAQVSFPTDTRQLFSLYSCLGATILFDNDKYDGYPFTSKQQYSNIVNIHKEIQQLKNSINTDCKSIISKKYQQKQSNTLKRKHSPSISSTNQSP